jgi:hypothetical protein
VFVLPTGQIACCMVLTAWYSSKQWNGFSSKITTFNNELYF